MKEKKKNYGGIYFLFTVIIIYFVTGFLKTEVVVPSLKFSETIFRNILPVFIFVFIIMIVLNYFMNKQTINKYLGKSAGIKKWFVAIVVGIISMGPIYMWYPFLKELKAKDVSYGVMATFLYNKAIKLPLFPLLFFYFGLKYVIILTIVMIVASVSQGLLFESLEKRGFL